MVAGGKDRRVVMEFRVDMYTLLYLKQVINKDRLSSTGNSAQWYMAVSMGGNLEQNGCMYMYGLLPPLFI